jgi:Skp family chaperone for outer membrane proteins
MGGYSQKRELVRGTKVNKIAFLDHSKLRREYKEYSAKLKELFDASVLEKNDLARKVADLNGEMERKLKKDSLSAGKKTDAIILEYEKKKSTLISFSQLKQQGLNNEKMILLKKMEEKIRLAIDAVVNEGGFTDVKPIDKNYNESNGLNITNLVLKKLN